MAETALRAPIGACNAPVPGTDSKWHNHPDTPIPSTESILCKITQALDKHGMAPTRFGRLAVGDPRLVGDLHRGRELRRATEASVNALLASMATASPYERKRGQGSPAPRHAIGQTLPEVRQRTMMRRGSAALLTAILSAKGEA